MECYYHVVLPCGDAPANVITQCVEVTLFSTKRIVTINTVPKRWHVIEFISAASESEMCHC